MKILNWFKFNTLAPIALLFCSILLFGCEKENTIQTTNPLSNKSNILQDSTFNILLSDMQKINLTASNVNSDKLLSQNEFELIYNKAINENDVQSKNEISKVMGFSDYSLFWEAKNRISNNIVLLNKKYGLNKLSTTELKGVISDGLANKNSNKNKSKMTFMFDPNECIEKYADCLDEAIAEYAVEQVACVGAGALGWTIIGGVMFVACEAASNYHLYVNNRSCRTNLKYCK
jgi:hypothetical protein